MSIHLVFPFKYILIPQKTISDQNVQMFYFRKKK